MGIEDIIAMMEKLDVDLADPLGGYLFYLMKVNDSTRITKEQFDEITNYLKIDNIADFKKKLPVLRK